MIPIERVFFAAINAGNAAEVKKLLGTNRELILAEDDESSGPLRGDYPIHRACRVGNNEIVKAILEVSLNEKDRPKIDKDKGSVPAASPLMIAVAKQHLSVVKQLISVGANVNYVNHKDSGYTPIYFAISSAGKPGNPEIVQVLVDAGADVTHMANEMDPITFATGKGNEQIVSILKKGLQDSIEKLQRSKNEQEKQKAELKKQQAELAAKAGKIQSDLKDMREKHTQERVNYLSKVSEFALDQYKSAAVDGVDRSHQFEEMQRYNREVLSRLSPNAQQAYADAQNKQASSTASDQTSSPQNKPK